MTPSNPYRSLRPVLHSGAGGGSGGGAGAPAGQGQQAVATAPLDGEALDLDVMFAKLLAHREEHGHHNVPLNRRPVKVAYMRPSFNVPMVEWSS